MSGYLINGVYPTEYFDLVNVDKIQYPNQYWWSSKHRFAEYDPASPDDYLAIIDGGSQSVEMLEIDLGRVRQLNYMNMDVVKSPIEITVEYDAVSSVDGEHSWVEVTPLETMPFDRRLFYDASAKNAWINASFYFTDSFGNMVNTRYLRLKFARVPERWPTAQTVPFRWPVTVKSFRVARYITDLDTAAGPIFDTTASDATELTLETTGNQTVEVKQRFVMPENYQRGTIKPDMLGFSFLMGMNTRTAGGEESTTGLLQPQWSWSLYDVTDSALGTLLHQGSVTGTNSRSEEGWIDVFFDRGTIETSPDNVYEVRVHSINTSISPSVFVHSPNRIPGRTVPGLLTFVNNGFNSVVTSTSDPSSVLQPGDYFQKASGNDASPLKVVSIVFNMGVWDIQLDGVYLGLSETAVTAVKIYPFFQNGVVSPELSMALRVFGDVADEGRDVLGNNYRYATVRNRPKDILEEGTVGWMSAPQPSPDAVESLYFDVRTTDTSGKLAAQVIDAVRIAPRTPGVRMHVYYNDHAINGRTPDTIDEWEAKEWTPVQQLYTLRGNTVYKLPKQIRATYVKLEFSSLSPLPFKIPNNPPLPPVTYKRYPTWVETQFFDPTLNGYQRIVEDWFVRNKTVTMKRMIRILTDPVQEFQYKQREFLASLSLDSISLDSFSSNVRPIVGDFVDLKDHSLIDPITKSRIYFATNDMYRAPLTASVDQTSVLGQAIANRFDPAVTAAGIERNTDFRNASRAVVSTVNDRISEAYSFLAQTPMWFNRRCLHQYRIDRAQFNKKAYFVGITSVEFLRSNFVNVRDDNIIDDILHDLSNFDEMTWIQDLSTGIPADPIVYVSYQIGSLTVVDEPVDLHDFDPMTLANSGIVTNVIIYSFPNRQGVAYYRGEDYDVSYTTDDNGDSVAQITRAETSNRWVVAPSPVTGFVYSDADVVTGVGQAVAVSVNTDFSNVVGIGTASAEEYRESTDAAVSVGDGNPSSINIFEGFDAATAVAVADPSADEDINEATVDFATVTGVAAPSSSDTDEIIDVQTTTGIAVPSAIEGPETIDAATAMGVAIPSAVEGQVTTDAATITSVGVPSSIDIDEMVDSRTVTAIAAVSAVDTGPTYDAATETGVASPSAAETYIPNPGSGTYVTAVLADNPVAYYRLNEPSGTTVNDQEGLQNGTYSSFSGPLPTLGVAGATTDSDLAITLGQNQYVNIPFNAAIHSGDTFSFECWYNKDVEGISRSAVMVSMGRSGYVVGLGTTSGVVFLSKTAAGSDAFSPMKSTTGAYTDSTSWHHVVVTKSGSAMHIYVDGVEASYSFTSNQTIVSAGNATHLGQPISGSSNYWKGQLDEVAFYDYVLTAGQAAAHYAAR